MDAGLEDAFAASPMSVYFFDDSKGRVHVCN